MEFTAKGIAAVVLPAVVLTVGNMADKSLQWRAEMKQRQYERQTRIIDKILEIPNAEHRIASATFYLRAGTFTGDYKTEVETSLQLAQEELTMKRAQEEEAKRLAWELTSDKDKVNLMASVQPLPEATDVIEESIETGSDITEFSSNTVTEMSAVEPEELPIMPMSSIGPLTIFSYSKNNP